MTIDFARWCFDPKVWIILGILLVMADIFLGYNFFILPVGLAGFIIAGLLYTQQEQWIEGFLLYSDWHAIIISFAVISLISIFLLRLLLKQFRKGKKDQDINVY